MKKYDNYQLLHEVLIFNKSAIDENMSADTFYKTAQKIKDPKKWVQFLRNIRKKSTMSAPSAFRFS